MKDLNQARQIHQFYGVAPYWEGQQVAQQRQPQRQPMTQQRQQMTQQQLQQVTTVDSLKQFTLKDQQGQNLGQVSQVIVDVQQGQIGYIVTPSAQQPGQNHVIPWNALRVDTQQQTLTVQISADQFRQAPTGDEQMVQDMNQARQIHQFYGVAPYWESGTNQQQMQQMMQQMMEQHHQQMHQQSPSQR